MALSDAVMSPEEAANNLFGLGEPEPIEVIGNPEAIAAKYEPHPLLHDPVAWIRQAEFAWSVQRRVAESVEAVRYTAVPSAHDTGKSFIASRLACWWLDVHEPEECFVVTTAPTWQQVHAILWREMRQAKSKRNLRGRTTLDARWYIGGSRAGDEDEQLVAFGRKPADYDQAAFQGIHAKYVLVIIDEASGIPKLLYDAVDSLATNRFARVLAIGNPDDPASEFANICRPGSGWNVIPVSAFDTPAFTGEEVPSYLLDLLVSEEWVEERKKRWGEASPTYQSKVLGLFPDIGEDTLIPPKLIREAEARDLSGVRTPVQEGWDIARYGSDKTVGYRNSGGMLRLIHESEKQSTMKTAGRIKASVAPTLGRVRAIVDADGLGGGVVDRLREERVRNVHPFHGGRAAIDAARFVNRRSEVYWMFREAMEEGLIDLAEQGEEDDLKAQLGAIKWAVDSKGRIEVETKKAMKKRGLPSPDYADAAVYATVQGTLELPSAEERADANDDVPDTITGDLMDREM